MSDDRGESGMTRQIALAGDHNRRSGDPSAPKFNESTRAARLMTGCADRPKARCPEATRGQSQELAVMNSCSTDTSHRARTKAGFHIGLPPNRPLRLALIGFRPIIRTGVQQARSGTYDPVYNCLSTACFGARQHTHPPPIVFAATC